MLAPEHRGALVPEHLGAIDVLIACAVAIAAAYLFRTRASRSGRREWMIAWAAMATLIFGGMALAARVGLWLLGQLLDTVFG